VRVCVLVSVYVCVCCGVSGMLDCAATKEYRCVCVVPVMVGICWRRCREHYHGLVFFS